MTRQEKCKIALELGYTYNPITGQILGSRGFEVGHLRKEGYIGLYTPQFKHLQAHHFAWYYVYGNVDFEQLDHINQIKTDNRIDNLRIATHQLNQMNRTFKGYWFDKTRNKYKTSIMVNHKSMYQGYFNTEEEAKKKYLELKKLYHLSR
jgi:hypothetical protein